MKILIIAATSFEIAPLLKKLNIKCNDNGLYAAPIKLDGKEIYILITGVGMVNTAFMIGKYVNSNFNLIINAGIAGAFSKNLTLGELVNVTEDCISEMGAEDGNDFIKYQNLNLPGTNYYINHQPFTVALTDKLTKVKGITVNTVHGNEASIEKTQKLYNPQVESMEGAAFFAALENMSVQKIQIRSISNYVERRNKEHWKIDLAIKNLNVFLIQMIL